MNSRRLIVDGNNLLHAWRTHKGGNASDFETSRWVLARLLDKLADRLGASLMLVYDSTIGGREEALNSSSAEVIFTRSGVTADTVIERAVRDAAQPCNVTVITDDRAERLTVESIGADVMSCRAAIEIMEETALTTEGGRVGGHRFKGGKLGDFFPDSG